MKATDRPLTAAELLGAPEIPKRGRDRLVALAMELFYRHGFNAIGVDHVLAEAGVSKTTFYKHFNSKTELMVAVVEMREIAARAGAEDPRQFAALFTTLLEGTLVMRQALGRNDAARVALPVVDRLIEDHLAPTKVPATAASASPPSRTLPLSALAPSV